MSVPELIVAVLAVWEIIEIWHHSSLFATWRSRVELWEGWLGQLLRCPFCLSPWTALMVYGLLGAAGRVPSPWLGMILAAPVYAFALARAANLFNDLTHSRCRTPRHDRLELGSGDESVESKS